MPDKTTVTNPSVSESGDKTTVKNSSVSGSGEQELEKRVRQQVMGEVQREIAEMREAQESYLERIAELDEKVRLNESEKAEKARLAQGLNNMDEQIRLMETDPRYMPYAEYVKRSLNGTKDAVKQEAINEAVFQVRLSDARRLVSKTAKESGVKPEALQEEINEYLSEGYGERELKAGIFRYSHLDPLERAERALEDLAERKAIAKLKAESKKNGESNGELEGDGNGTNAPSNSEIPLHKIGSSDPASFTKTLMRLGAINQAK